MHEDIILWSIIMHMDRIKYIAVENVLRGDVFSTE